MRLLQRLLRVLSAPHTQAVHYLEYAQIPLPSRRSDVQKMQGTTCKKNHKVSSRASRHENSLITDQRILMSCTQDRPWTISINRALSSRLMLRVTNNRTRWSIDDDRGCTSRGGRVTHYLARRERLEMDHILGRPAVQAQGREVM